MLDLSIPTHREKLEELIKQDIDKYCQEIYDDGEHRDHLGASILGEPCFRKLWYTFRWCRREIFNGRMLRLFNVGNEAEPRFVSYLRGIGFEVLDKDPSTGKQFNISGCNGHYGGGLDGRCKAPERYSLSSDLIFLNEFKTNCTGSGFTSVDTDGVKKAKAKHYAQMCQYGVHYQLKYGLYLIENKNDSDIIVKIVELDWQYGLELMKKAETIIYSKSPPNRINENPAYYECKYCNFNGICHHNEPVEKNCRSCKFSSPTENATWTCQKFGIIPKDYIKIGCDQHESINYASIK